MFGDAVWVVGGNAPSAGRPLSTRCGSTRTAGSPAQSCPCGSTARRSPATGSDCSSSADRLPIQAAGKGRSAGSSTSSTVPRMTAGNGSTRLPEERASGAVAWDGQRLVFAGGLTRQDLNRDGKQRKASTTTTCGSGRAKASGANRPIATKEGRPGGCQRRQRPGMVSRRCRCRGNIAGAVGRRGPRGKRPHHAAIRYRSGTKQFCSVASGSRRLPVRRNGTHQCRADGTNKVVCVPETASPSPTLRPLPPLITSEGRPGCRGAGQDDMAGGRVRTGAGGAPNR